MQPFKKEIDCQSVNVRSETAECSVMIHCLVGYETDGACLNLDLLDEKILDFFS
jgi:hypothetical protein